MCVARQLFRDRQAAALAVQTILRAYMARQKYQALLRESKAGVIQKHVRALLARRAAQRQPHHDGEASGSRDHPCERTPSCAAYRRNPTGRAREAKEGAGHYPERVEGHPGLGPEVPGRDGEEGIRVEVAEWIAGGGGG